MRKLGWLLVMVSACGGSSSSGTAPDARAGSDGAATGSGEPADLAGITAAHNQTREPLGEPDLVWDPALATIAANWVAQCVDSDHDGLVDHNANRSSGYPTYVGENIFASSGTAGGSEAVADWVSEQQFYDHSTNTCAAGQVCGHYTQVVWKATAKLGCALGSCPSLTYPSTIVCDYGPGGNIEGQSPY